MHFSDLPPTLVINAHFNTNTADELQEFEDNLTRHGVPLSYDPAEARLFLTKTKTTKRALLELRTLKLKTRTIEQASGEKAFAIVVESRQKRARLGFDDSDTASETEVEPAEKAQAVSGETNEALARFKEPGFAQVVHVAWFEDSLAAGKLLAMESYTVYSGIVMPSSVSLHAGRETARQMPVKPYGSGGLDRSAPLAAAIIERGAAYAGGRETRSTFRRSGVSKSPRQARKIPSILHETTSDHEGATDLPPPPEWVTEGLKYACQRSTVVSAPNSEFLELLKEIRLTRTLQSDDIGVRAYSTTIAAIAAYPYTITHQSEVSRLPGCNEKTAALWKEWSNTGRIGEAESARRDERLKVLKIFFEIWGIGAHGARALYDKGRRDLDDVIEFEWNNLTRVQQIGLKYYDEFMMKIPRQETEAIRDHIMDAFRIVVEQRAGEASDCRSCIVGGYRRGKIESGDIDVIVSHLDEKQTQDMIVPLVEQLSRQGYITHNLITYTSSSQREQAMLPFRGENSHGGHGFDSLDKGFVVWQDLPSPVPSGWSSMTDDDKAAYRKQHPKSLEGKVHRRVDIIVAPWKRIGCAVLGWSAGTTFERDIRRYVKAQRAWKFDSSGVRDRATGRAIDIERRADGSRCTTIDEAERAVFDGMGLKYIPPEERATG